MKDRQSIYPIENSATERPQGNIEKAERYAYVLLETFFPYLQSELDAIKNVMDYDLSCELLDQLPERVLMVVRKKTESRYMEKWDDDAKNTFSAGRKIFLEGVVKRLEEEINHYSLTDGPFREYYNEKLKIISSSIKELI